MGRTFGQYDLASGADDRLQQMAAVRGSVRFADDDMRVHLRLAILQRDVPDRCRYQRHLFDPVGFWRIFSGTLRRPGKRARSWRF